MKFVIFLLFIICIKSQVPPIEEKEGKQTPKFTRIFCPSLHEWYSNGECKSFDESCDTDMEYRHEFYGCLKCTGNFFARNGICVQDTEGICEKLKDQVGCVKLKETTESGEQTAGNFYIKEGVPTRIENCKTSDPLKGCIECKQGGQNYWPLGGECVEVKNCANFDETEGCSKCLDDYYLENGFCVEKDKGVVDVNGEDGTALTCDNGNEEFNTGSGESSYTYYADGTKKCKRCDAQCQICKEAVGEDTNHCKKCFDGYYLIPELDKCIKMHEGCAERYDPYAEESKNKKGCKKCKPGYFRTVFNASGVLVDSCSPQQDTCVESDINKGCTKCAEGYTTQESNVDNQGKVNICNGAVEVLGFALVALLVLLF